MRDELQVSTTFHEEPLDSGGWAVRVEGELDVATAPALRERVVALIAAGAERLILDLSAVTFIDSVATAAIVSARRRLAARGRLAVVTDDPYVELIFEAGGLDGVLELFATRAEAEAYVAS